MIDCVPHYGRSRLSSILDGHENKNVCDSPNRPLYHSPETKNVAKRLPPFPNAPDLVTLLSVAFELLAFQITAAKCNIFAFFGINQFMARPVQLSSTILLPEKLY